MATSVESSEHNNSHHHQKGRMHAGCTLNKQKPQVCCPMCRMFMNPFPDSLNSEDYEPSIYEEWANILTHAIPFPIFVYMFYKLFSEVVNTWEEFVAASLYCMSLLTLFLISTSYHVMSLVYGKLSTQTLWFRIGDYATIYIFIAACYTPFLMVVELGPYNLVGNILTAIVWCLAICGLIKTFSLGSLLQKISNTTLFHCMGWVALIGIPQSLFLYIPLEAYFGLFVGGLCFSFGVFFLRGDGVIPFSHAIWHLISVVGILIHFLSIYWYMFELDEGFHPSISLHNNVVVWKQLLELWNGDRTLFSHLFDHLHLHNG